MDNQHAKGLLLTLIGVLALGPDALIVRLVGIDHWTLLVWRGVFTAIGIYLVVFFQYRSGAITVIKNTGRKGLLISVLFTGSTICFISALTFTSVAHTLIIVSTSPIFASLLSRFFLGEEIRHRTILVMIIVMVAIYYMVTGDQNQQNSLFGDGLAALTSLFLAATFVATRQARNFDMTPSMALSGLITALVSLPFASPGEVGPNTLLLLVLLSGLLTLSFTMLMLAPRYIPAPEVSLMMPIETVVSVALVWWIIGEVPSQHAIIGGTIIIVCLTINSILLLRSRSEAA